MLHLTFVLMAFFGVAPDAAVDASIIAPTAVEAAADLVATDAMMTPAGPAMSSLVLTDKGLRVLLPTPSLEICDPDRLDPCPPGCLCVIVAGQVNCWC